MATSESSRGRGSKPSTKRKKKKSEKKNKYSALFKEEEKAERQRLGILTDDEKEDLSDSDHNADAKGVALFDLDLYGRKIADPHTAGFGKTADFRWRRGTRRGSLEQSSDEGDLLDVDDQQSGTTEEHEEWSDDEDKEDAELENALFNEWDLMALERARRAVDDGYAYLGDSTEGDAYRKLAQGKLGAGDPMLLPRVWESSFYLTTLQNIENKPQFFFYVVTFGHVNSNRKISGALRRRVLYSPGFYLKAGEYRALSAPLPIWPQKTLPICYKDLTNYAVTIDLWKISAYTFNTLYASTTFSLQDVVDMDPDSTVMLQRKLPNKKRSYEVQRLKVFFQMSEVFDFDLFFESWSFNPSSINAARLAQVPKLIKFILPKGVGQPWKVRWTEASTSGFWRSPLSMVYRGTMQDLQNAYFIAKVYIKTEGGFLFSKPTLIGTALMSLRSVATYSLFRSMVKQLTLREEEFKQGEVTGNIRCFIRSTGLPYYEDAASVKRPVQPLAGAALVTQLDFREQFLVVRLFRCENLPAANLDAGTSDPVVKVKWDGMTNSSSPKIGTLRPIWNQSLYFPVRLLDPQERTSAAYIQHCLPVDLLSKGNILFECWDQDETSSDFLGGCELHLSELTNSGKVRLRCLAEGLRQGDSETARMADGRPVAFQYLGEDADPGDMPPDTSAKVALQPYEIPYHTRVYSGNGIELTGATIATSVTAKPLIFFEVFCIPPLPESIELPAPLPVKEEQDLWKQWSRRWDRDFTRWQHIYQEWFPTAPKGRRFLCTADHPQTRRLHPLPAFVTPIAVPEQISDEGELLHWVTNMAFLIATKQFRSGLITRWLSPNYFLITRKSGVNDHAVLLCSCLLGLDYDAYVCKGTINNGTCEHCWVMTRHEDGWVMFWELTNKKRYHLPARWGYRETRLKMAEAEADALPACYWLNMIASCLPNSLLELTDVCAPVVSFVNISAGSNSVGAGGAPEESSYYYGGDFLKEWYAKAASECGILLPEQREFEEPGIYGDDVVPDVRLEDMDLTFEGWGQTKDKPQKRRKVKTKLDLDKLRAWMETQIEAIPIAPKKNLLDPDATLCYLPYSTIEVVFNHEQLWGNLQNHHPAVIYYDLEDTYLWRPFLTAKPNPIDSFIFIAPSTRDKACDLLNAQIQADVAENVRVLRQRRGLETQVDHGEDKSDRLEKYLDLLEFRLRLDPDYDPGPPPNHEAWSAWGAYESVENMQDYSTAWYSHLQKDPADVTLYGWDKAEQSAADNSAEPEVPSGVIELEQLQAQNLAYPSDAAAYAPQPLTRVEPKKQHTPLVAPQFQTVSVHGASLNDIPESDNLRHLTSNEFFQKPLTNTQMCSTETSDPSSQTKIAAAQSTAVDTPTPKRQAEVRHSICTTDMMDKDRHKTFAVPARFSYTASDNRAYRFMDCADWEAYSLNSFPDVLDPTLVSPVRSNSNDSGSSTDSDDTASVLRYCARKNIRLATKVVDIPLQSPRTESIPDEFPFLFPQDSIGADASQHDSQTPSAKSEHPDCQATNEPAHAKGRVFLASPVPPKKTATVSSPLNATASGSLKSKKTVELPVFGSRRHARFQKTAAHEMILDDYEDFQQEQLRKQAPQAKDPLSPQQNLYVKSPLRSAASSVPGGLPHTPPSVASSHKMFTEREAPGKQAAKSTDKELEDYYKVLQKPAKALDQPQVETLDIEKLGFTIRDTPGGAVYAAPTKQEKLLEQRDGQTKNAAITSSDAAYENEFVKQDLAVPARTAEPPSKIPAAAIAPAVTSHTGVPPPQVFRRPVVRSQYPADQTAKWNYYYRMEALYYEWQKLHFPVRPSHTFCGFPLHFATTDSSDIRSFLLSSRRFRRIIEVPVDGVTYVIRCKVYPLMGGVVSCWLFIGCEIHWAGKQERLTRMKRPHRKKQRKPQERKT